MEITVGGYLSYQYTNIILVGDEGKDCMRIYNWNNKKNSISRSVLHDCTVLFLPLS